MLEPLEAASTWKGPLFIVGYSRSGTELARAILNSHSRIHICDETHYFDDLRPRLKKGSHSDPTDREKVLRYFDGMKGAGYALASADKGAHRRTGHSEAPQSPWLGADAAFQRYCQQAIQDTKTTVWGEKTPRHLFRVREMLSAFPEAKFLILIRHPCGVVASYRDWKNRWFSEKPVDDDLRVLIDNEERRTQLSYNISITTLLWIAAARATSQLQAALGPKVVQTLRFEDLLDQPERSVRRIMEWVGQPYEPVMLDVRVVNSSYVSPSTHEGPDRSIAARWRDVLGRNEIAYVGWLARRTARKAGYEVDSPSPNFQVIMSEFIILPVALLRAWRANSGRIASPFSFVGKRLLSMLLPSPRISAFDRDALKAP